MKMLLLIPICFIVLLGCGLIATTDHTESFIPGTYIRKSSHEFGVENDTIVITIQNEEAHQYEIVRKWRYDRVLDGNPVEPEYKRVPSSGIYFPEQKGLRESETGTVYTFDTKEKVLINGSIKYNKL